MNKNKVIKYSASYEDKLFEALEDPDEAQAYLEAAIESYQEDGDTE